MKKRNNKTIILVLIGISFFVFLGIFILNYSKDDSSYSLLEKKWINDNTKNIIDVSIYNDIPVFGKNGTGVSFDILDSFTNKHGVNFNKVSYLTSEKANMRDIAYHIMSPETKLTDNDILIYNDKYVLISKTNNKIDSIDELNSLTVNILEDENSYITSYLSGVENIKYAPKKNIDDIIVALNGEENSYAIVPYNKYLSEIMENDYNILYKFNDLYLNYVLTIKDKTFLGIMKKYYKTYSISNQSDNYKENFLNEFFIDKEIKETDRLSYNSSSYNIGYITYMPFTDKEEKDFVGTLSNYLSEFEDTYDISFKLIHYDNIDKLKKDLSAGLLDVVFANFSPKGLNIDIIETISPFKEEYSVLSKDKFTVDSVKGLKNREVMVLNGSYLNDLLINNGVEVKTYDNTLTLIKGVKNTSTIVIDKATYEYYKTSRFSNFNEIYTGTLNNEYKFLIRDVNKNTVFATMFTYYVSTVNYNDVKFNYNTNSKIKDYGILTYFIAVVLFLVIVLCTIFAIKIKKNKKLSLKNTDKLKYIDTMTSLKNRAYLNLKIKEWDDNVIYPQAFLVIDLNNIKHINDNKGHEEGDIVIKKAASILIVNQEPNTDIIRTDGTEFLIYMIGYSEKDVIAYSRKIYKELKELPYGFGATIGYSMIMDDIKTVDDAINEATIDMRNKKETNKE